MLAQNNNNRNSNIELLRFVLMFVICFWHLLVHGVGVKNIGMIDEATIGWNEFFLCSLFVPAVNCFMPISGYYGIRLSTNKMLTLILQAFVIFCVSFFIKYYFIGAKWTQFVYHLFPIANKNRWFLTEYFCIMLLAPIINKGLEQISKKMFTMVLLYLLFINSFGLYLVRASLGSNLLSLLIIYLLGRYLHLYKIEFTRWKIISIGSCSCILLFILTSSCYQLGFGKVSWLLFSYNNPLILLQAICVFYLVKYFKEHRCQLFIFLGKHAFSIYLITGAIGISILYPFGASLYTINPWLAIGAILLTMMTCVFIDCLQAKLNAGIRFWLFHKFPVLNF